MNVDKLIEKRRFLTAAFAQIDQLNEIRETVNRSVGCGWEQLDLQEEVSEQIGCYLFDELLRVTDLIRKELEDERS